MFQPDNNKAKPGDLVEFKREDLLLTGKVLPSNCKNSIIVEISSENDLEAINYSHPNTVVSHKKYRIR
ncbi:uncharacterized protein YkvS [Virgibacillus natechei]|uniref:Uncharacterized protein YkvS n=1 Tax=Virgibacillus natechei TaxID=1216297 RepID=A0ABS4IKC9_9BACI|nr:DUF2187 family protein [Virgibacillus natechei]MBP1970791.1 uncharacterized protein YkvS [Virgibacillus natechei]UZD12308.1 YkvS family protein [Virgibacillus natechei]